MDGLLPAIKSSDGQRSRARKRAETINSWAHARSPASWNRTGAPQMPLRQTWLQMPSECWANDCLNHCWWPSGNCRLWWPSRSTSRSKSARSSVLCVFDGTPCLQQEAKTLHHGLLQQTDRVVISETTAKLHSTVILNRRLDQINSKAIMIELQLCSESMLIFSRWWPVTLNALVPLPVARARVLARVPFSYATNRNARRCKTSIISIFIYPISI